MQMPKNSQGHFKDLAALAAKHLKCFWPFWEVYFLTMRIERIQLM